MPNCWSVLTIHPYTTHCSKCPGCTAHSSTLRLLKAHTVPSLAHDRSVSESRVMKWGVNTFEGFLFLIELQSGYWLNSPDLRQCHRNSQPLAWKQWRFVDRSRKQRQPPAILSSTLQIARAPLWPQWALSCLAAGRLIQFWLILVVETPLNF